MAEEKEVGEKKREREKEKNVNFMRRGSTFCAWAVGKKQPNASRGKVNI